jgi:hypothetical protein
MHQRCYSIRPKQTLRDALGSRKSDVTDVLLQAEVFTQAESDRSSWSQADYALQVRIVFLAWLRSEYGETDECRSVLGDGVLRADDFDKYWELEVHSPDEIAWVARQLSKRRIASQVVETGSAVVDAWVTDVLGLPLATR